MFVFASEIKKHPVERVALRDETQTIHYGDLIAEIDRRARQLNNVQCLAIQLDNCVEWVLWDLAALKSGVPCVPIPPFFTQEQIEHTFRTAGVSHAIAPQGLQSTDLTAPVALPPRTVKVTFTSGSTGTPKGVCLPAKALFDVAQSLVTRLGDNIHGTHHCVLPLAVLLENVAGVYAGLIAGCTIQLCSLAKLGKRYENLHSILQQASAVSAILVPEILRALIFQTQAAGSIDSLRFVAIGGTRIDPAIIEQARGLGLPVYEGYGLSECGSVVALNTPGDDIPGSVGRPLPHVQFSIDDDGEIILKNPGFLGYVGEPFKQQSFLTGDLGHQADNGFLYVDGRSKNLLITASGRNVSPEWVEATLLGQSDILQTVVYGDGQSSLSALIVPGHADADIEMAISRANLSLPEYAQIRHFEVVPAFTVENGMLTGNGRIRRATVLYYYTKEPTMTFFQKLVQQTESARQQLYRVPLVANALNGNISRATYIAYLTQAFHHVSHTVPFLMTMGAHLPVSKKNMHKVIAEYLTEEVGHEEWILNDIEAAGGDKEAARKSVPNLETQVLVAYNYDYIQRKNPMGFLGMVFMLESTSTQIASRGADAAKKSLKLPDEAFSYLYSHGELDIDHMEFFEKTVNRITDIDDQNAIIEVANNTFHLFANLLAAIPCSNEVRDVA